MHSMHNLIFLVQFYPVNKLELRKKHSSQIMCPDKAKLCVQVKV